MTGGRRRKGGEMEEGGLRGGRTKVGVRELEDRKLGGGSNGGVMPGNQLVYYICIHLLDPHWTMYRQAVISTQQHKLYHYY